MDIEITTSEGGVLPGILAGELDAGTAVLLAHGAGAGQHHPWMVDMRERIADRGFLVMTFDYPYMAEGRRAPDRLPKLVDAHRAAFLHLADLTERVVLAGKSMGARVGGHLAAAGDVSASGLSFFGYPLVAIGKTEPRPTDHLEHLAVPMLFVSGDRDRMGPIDSMRELAGRVPSGTLEVIVGGDHSLAPLKRSGRTLGMSLDQAADALSTWIAATIPSH